MPLHTVTTVAECRAALEDARRAGREIALVPTMGALHEGHAALVRHAREVADVVVVSIFVNPLQFGERSDLERYPRTLEADQALLEELGADLLLAPDAEQMYPDGGSSTTVHAGPLGDELEGASRPGHFDGVLTVVTKLLNITQPTIVCFGEKDAQQVFLVRRMIRDLDLPVAVHEIETVREADGLARSSRNVFLDDRQHEVALTLSRALRAAAAARADGVPAMLRAGRAVLDAADDVDLDYLTAVDPETFAPAPDDHAGDVRLLVAARVGPVRLIDTLLAQS
ncbi:pantoate--beta-alanine ligase [Barrientosiimonas humi]|uniref:Pantothenate synthetase n=1 Tax=Barrientosiimonas humi TaxID=999931 RepID=A0A542X837_9MICO|nr:pantoate--beta-alanine ligase [Barrientosiimonas humi]TQL31979.1 pantoate--beta-alanine ligase [Barrientosiimonas humi]CAG7571848.1 Pantothenate synthetase [Barrientosiimonas humi]